MNCISLIRQRYSCMSPVEKRIADCILEEPEKVMNSPLVYVAARANVSEGSVINFSNALGCKGFSQLKINLAQNVSSYSVQDEVTKEDTPKEIMRKLMNRAAISFESTYDTIQTQLQDAAELLLHAGKIVVYGVGPSTAVARDISICMMRIGLPAIMETDPLLAAALSTQMGERDVLFAISNSGRTKEILEVAETAGRSGGKVICLTSHANSLLTSLSHVSLVAVSMEAQNHREAATARLTQLLIGDCLTDFLANQMMDEAVVNQDKMAEVYERHREAVHD